MAEATRVGRDERSADERTMLALAAPPVPPSGIRLPPSLTIALPLLPKHAAQGRRGGGGPRLPAQIGQAIDFGRIGDFGKRLHAGGAGGNQQQLVAATEQMRLLAVGQRARPSTSNASAGSRAAPGGDARRSTQTSAKKIPSTSARLPNNRDGRRQAVRFLARLRCGSRNCAASAPATARPVRRTIPAVPPPAQYWADSSAGHADRRINTIVQIADRMSWFPSFHGCVVAKPQAACWHVAENLRYCLLHSRSSTTRTPIFPSTTTISPRPISRPPA